LQPGEGGQGMPVHVQFVRSVLLYPVRPVEQGETCQPELRDPKDLPVLACAVAGEVELIVTGDADLLTMQSFQGIAILTARQALEKLGIPPR